MKISNRTTGKLLPVGQPMKTNKTFINKIKQDMSWMMVHCRWWSMPIWVGMICLSVGIFSSPTLFAAPTINWNADRAIDALGPARKVKWSDGIITYPATGKATLKDVFPTLSMQWGSSKTLDQVEFRLKAGHGEIFKVPRVVSGRYECSIEAKFTNGRPGVAIPKENMAVDIDGTGTKYSKSPVALVARTTGNQDDESVAKAELSDLSFDVSCQGVNFSWERKADEKVEFETQNVHAPVGILIDGGDFMWWSRPILPTIKDPVTVISPPECIFESQSSEDFDLGEIRREPSDAIFPKELHRATVETADLLISVLCDTPNKDDTGVAIVNFSTEHLGVDGKSIVMDTSKTGGKDFGNALEIKVLPRVLGIQTKLVGGNQIGQPVTFGSATDPKSVLVFNVDDKSAVKKIKRDEHGNEIGEYYSHHSFNRFSVQLWQTKAIDPKLSGEFKTSMEATLVMK
ncbi:hypothetical protein CKY10_04150 [Photorhabdus sp. HUG-39]|uniref:Fimbrial protein n=2 Tax=Photorhabdus kayaii TaxID=230088 RepID=A0ABX0AVE6_9GAMM|nr:MULTISPECIES: hypothetical protein [Photorhabdus]MCC8373032.1 hypothetical protein [Photorhabdus bodei]NDL24540.1 hypothetical protein [Photorhabdus kayaii]RAX11332.1 hypothetical protein CKY10_04150 [Photorhabdus sp. HUG-39]